MKKYLKWMIIVAVTIGLLKVYKYDQDKSTLYYFADNENGYYDEIYDYSDLPPYVDTLSPSQEKLDAISSLDNVVGVYPFISLNTLLEEQDWEETITEISAMVNGQKKVIQLPQKLELTYNDSYVLTDIYATSYVDESYVTNNIVISDEYIENNGSRIVKEFSNCNSGIYIGEELYNLFGADENTESFQITLPFYVPITSKIGLERYTTPTDEYGIPYGEDEFDFYAESQSISRYQQVTFTFDVQGILEEIIKQIYIPVNTMVEMCNQIDTSQIVLEENEILYQPNGYIIKLEKKESIHSLGRKIDEVIDNFALGHFWFGREIVSY